MLKFLTAFIVAICVLVLASYFSPIFKIKSISFNEDQNCLTEEKQLQKYNLSVKNLLLLNLDKLTESLKSDFPCINELSIKKTFPTKLEFDVKSSQPVVEIEGSNLAIFKDGLVTQKDSSNKLPAIFMPPNVQANLGQKIINPTTLIAIEIAVLLTKTDFTVQNIRIIESTNIVAYDSNGTVVQFSSSKSPTAQVDSLQFILSKAKIDAVKIAKIDLRFDKPVISAKTTNGKR